MPAVVLIVLLLLVAAVCAVAGVWTLFGLGWALITLALVLTAAAALLRRGLS